MAGDGHGESVVPLPLGLDPIEPETHRQNPGARYINLYGMLQLG